MKQKKSLKHLSILPISLLFLINPMLKTLDSSTTQRTTPPINLESEARSHHEEIQQGNELLL